MTESRNVLVHVLVYLSFGLAHGGDLSQERSIASSVSYFEGSKLQRAQICLSCNYMQVGLVMQGMCCSNSTMLLAFSYLHDLSNNKAFVHGEQADVSQHACQQYEPT